jgi:hypothetical protein
MLSEFDRLVKQRKDLKAWWELGSTIAQYDNKFHSLRVDVQTPSLITFCGQQYAGARNYHDAPKFFEKAVMAEMGEHANEIVRAAYNKEIARLDNLIAAHKEAVLKELEVA